MISLLAKKTLLRVITFYAYGLFVAWIFTLIEKRDEPSYERREKMLETLERELHLRYNMTDKDFNNFVKRTENAVKAGDELDWTFLNSAGFVFAALTTIGFGHITPKNPSGQGITILFCLIGIPITMLAMKSAGELWASSIEFIVRKIEKDFLKRGQPSHVKKKTLFVACTLTVLVLILAAISTAHLEDWTFIESLYAWFISLTTIGFGDYVHLKKMQRDVDEGKAKESTLLLYGMLLSLPYMIGLSLMSCILSILVDSIDHIRNFRDRVFRLSSSCNKSAAGNGISREGEQNGQSVNSGANTTIV